LVYRVLWRASNLPQDAIACGIANLLFCEFAQGRVDVIDLDVPNLQVAELAVLSEKNDARRGSLGCDRLT
jgi:hypothetical protein